MRRTSIGPARPMPRSSVRPRPRERPESLLRAEERAATGARGWGPARRKGMKPRGDRDHYSYTVYADPATARSFDDRRFGGPIGNYVAASQALTLADFIGRIQHRRILDVGTGTGRAALLFAHGGAEVTGVDASSEMLTVARERAERAGIAV